MDIDGFAAITRRVMARDGFEKHLPVACFLDSGSIVVLQGYPDPIVPPPVVHAFAAQQRSGSETYLVAFRIGPTQFRVDRVEGTTHTSKVFDFAAGS
jgi:hypothetical protein